MALQVCKREAFERRRSAFRCDRCLNELENGQGYYQLAGIVFCRQCLPQVAEALFLPWLLVVGEGDCAT